MQNKNNKDGNIDVSADFLYLHCYPSCWGYITPGLIFFANLPPSSVESRRAPSASIVHLRSLFVFPFPRINPCPSTKTSAEWSKKNMEPLLLARVDICRIK